MNPSLLLDFCLPRWQSEAGFCIEDAYKWLFQAINGARHAVVNPDSIREEMEKEWFALKPPLPGETLWQPLRPDETIGRLHLRPYRAAGGTLLPLVEAFLLGACTSPEEKPGFDMVWHEFGNRLEGSSWQGLTVDEWRRVDEICRTPGYPPIHHSRSYEAAHHPAYRVLPGTLFSTLWSNDGIMDIPTNPQHPV